MKHLGVINSVSDFLEKTEGVHYHVTEHTRFFCRGQASMTLRLRPKIGRYRYAGPRMDFPEPAWQSRMKLMFSQFEREYVAHNDVDFPRKLDRMALAQHYGLATQLLDWTLNPLVALYFACERESQDNGIVFIVGDFSMRPGLVNDADLDNARTVQALRPRRFDQRMINQDSVLTFHPDPIADFADALGTSCNGVFVPGNCKHMILNQLASIGIHEAFIYPGLKSVCNRINAGHREMYNFAQDKAFNAKAQEARGQFYSFDEDLNDVREPYLSDQPDDDANNTSPQDPQISEGGTGG